MKSVMKKSVMLTLTALQVMGLSRLLANKSAQESFTSIYENKIWGTNSQGIGHSGGGSTLENTVLYRQFLQNFFLDYNIHSVVDVGCGDWEFSKAIDWEGIDYFGYDVVASVISNNQAKYASPSIHFFHKDTTTTYLPHADLLICKDVLQHLPNEDILSLISQFPKFKYCLIVNDIDNFNGNYEINRADHRAVDLTQAPFYISGEKILTFNSGPNLKQVLLIEND